MDKYKSIRKWTDLYGIAVVTGGKRVGTVDDFYLEPETNAVRALRIKAGVLGYRELQASAISSFSQDRITIANEQMLAEERSDGRLPALLLGRKLLTYNVESEKGTPVGKVGNVLIDTRIPFALRVAAFELRGDSRERSGQRRPILDANEVTAYERDTIFILDKAARRLG
jgi:sporulation protein YlmC with PRC-barrel domain